MSDAAWSVERMTELGHRHSRHEYEQEMEPLLETLVPEPHYEFYPLAGRLDGMERVRRYYRHLFEGFFPLVTDSRLVDEWIKLDSMAQEYDVTVTVDGAETAYRVLGILQADTGAGLLTGERIYASEALLRLMLGPAFDWLQPL